MGVMHIFAKVYVVKTNISFLYPLKTSENAKNFHDFHIFSRGKENEH